MCKVRLLAAKPRRWSHLLFPNLWTTYSTQQSNRCVEGLYLILLILGGKVILLSNWQGRGRAVWGWLLSFFLVSVRPSAMTLATWSIVTAPTLVLLRTLSTRWAARVAHGQMTKSPQPDKEFCKWSTLIGKSRMRCLTKREAIIYPVVYGATRRWDNSLW